MKFPYSVIESLDPESCSVWEKVFAPTKGTDTDKTVEESLWRRTQSEKNALVSGWKNQDDKRRKILYYRHEYDLTTSGSGKKSLSQLSTYIYVSLTMPRQEIEQYFKALNKGRNRAGWTQQGELGDLRLEIKIFNRPEDYPFEYDSFPSEYAGLELCVRSNNFLPSEKTMTSIWGVMKYGMRKSLDRNNPTYVTDPKQILPHLPAQVELGCGASYEAGVLPLHTLHEIYSINEPFTKKFILNADEDVFVTGVVSDPERILGKTSNFFAKIVTCPLTEFYKSLAELRSQGLVVGPIITNNFDGLHLRLGIPEIFIRTYKESEVMPNIQFDPKAKSLLVIGCHADRRNVEMSARAKGLKIIYIDPEGWNTEDGWHDYPLESPQEEDLIFKKGASEAMKNILDASRVPV